MEYDFYTDALGQPKAQFSMGYETLAYCLNEQYQQINEVHPLITTIKHAIELKLVEKTITGRFYTIEIQQDEVIVTDNLYLDESSMFDEDDGELASSVMSSACGLEDFYSMLLLWWQHVQNC